MKRVFVLLVFVGIMMGAALLPGAQPGEAQPNCYETGFCINNSAFAEYFRLRGGARSFGFPISRVFTFMGFQVQFFQGHIMQLMPDGRAVTMNLLQEGLMPATRVNGSTFPGNDPGLVNGAPQVGAPDYSNQVVEFVRANAPNQFSGRPVRFFDTFMNTVDLATAFPGGGGNAALLPLLNLEIWGVVTSPPMVEPSNSGFIYQRFQRSIMHYRDDCQCTERILLAQWFKTVITGDGLPGDLAEQMANTPFIRQYSPGSPGWLARPGALPNTDMTNAFTPDQGGPGPVIPPAPTGPTNTPVPGDEIPVVSLQIDDDRTDPGDPVSVTVIARDDKGLKWIEWREVERDADNDNSESDFDPILRERHRVDCEDRVECASVWTVSPTVGGLHLLQARARDTADQDGVSAMVELRIRETATPTVTMTLTPGPSATPTVTPEPTATATVTPTPMP